MTLWNPWHGCQKYSEGCRNCYVYRRDNQYNNDSSSVYKTRNFDLPIRKKRGGDYHIPSGSLVWTCFTSDFFLHIADPWRNEAWQMIKNRPDLHFFFITKRIDRFFQCIPQDWDKGYDNVSIGCTMENQRTADIRLPIFLDAPIKHKTLICEPLLSAIDFHGKLGPWLDKAVIGGESGYSARLCDFSWIMDIRRQCIEAHLPFYFKQTGYRLRKDGKVYTIPRRFQAEQARRAHINYPEDLKLNSW